MKQTLFAILMIVTLSAGTIRAGPAGRAERHRPARSSARSNGSPESSAQFD